MAQIRQDQLRSDSQGAARLRHAGQQPIGGDGEGQAPVGMGLGIEEDFRVNPAVGRQPLEIGHGEIVEVLFGLQHPRALIIDVEEVLQVGEGVGGAHLFHRLEWEADLVALGQGEHQFGLEAALDVNVEFGLGQAANEIPGRRHGWLALECSALSGGAPVLTSRPAHFARSLSWTLNYAPSSTRRRWPRCSVWRAIGPATASCPM